jgi:hypothetical protein
MRAAHRYLNAKGFKISYQHFIDVAGQGKVPRDVDGNFTRKDLDTFGKRYLKNFNQVAAKSMTDYNLMKIKADADNKRIMAARGELKLQLEQGKLIERDKHEEELAARMAFFKRELETFMLRRSSDVVDIAKGPEPVEALLAWWKEAIAAWLDIWSSSRVFLVELDVMKVDPGVLGKGRGRARGMTGPKVSGPKASGSKRPSKAKAAK